MRSTNAIAPTHAYASPIQPHATGKYPPWPAATGAIARNASTAPSTGGPTRRSESAIGGACADAEVVPTIRSYLHLVMDREPPEAQCATGELPVQLRHRGSRVRESACRPKPRASVSRTPDPLRDSRALIERVYSYVASRIGAGQDAEDVTSTVFERAVRYRNGYDPDKGTPTTWVLGIARRAVADHLGRDLPTPYPADELETDDPAPSTEDAVVQRLTLDEAIARLDDHDAELLSLRYGGDLKAREIAVVLEMETHAVEVALSRALGRLRRLLDETDVRV